MKVTIHRGTHQIGGTITEIQSNKARIFIDMGDELPSDDIDINPIEIKGVTTIDTDCDGVFFTHNHGDHIGMYSKINKSIPLYLGEASKEIYLTLQKRLKSPYLNQIINMNTFNALDKIVIKDITITPLLVDHSAYDSYMFIIESNGKRILHTGDFRNHGFKGKGLFKTLRVYAKNVDLLITEGTTLSRNNQIHLTEYDLELKVKELIKQKKYIFVLCSSTNIDRIAAFYHANEYGRYFICDDYQKEILDIVNKYGSKYTELYKFDKVHTYGDNLLQKLKEKGFCMLVRSNPQFDKIISKFDKDESLIVYSLWQGYLTRTDNNLKEFLKHRNMVQLHTSGHADPGTIKRVIEIVNPKEGVIPIHSDNPKLLSNLGLSNKVILLNDGECFDLN